jgi:hypothetical protein
MGLDLCHSIPISKHSTNEFCEYLTVDELEQVPDYLHRHTALICTVLEYEGEIIKGIFLREIGYQRKGMKSKFYVDFENGKRYFKLQDVEKAYSYLKADHINSLKDLQENFKRKFIGNFVEGESVFWASW